MNKMADLWDDLVNGSDDSSGTEDEKLKPLLKEINFIIDESVRSFVRSCLLKADVFWEIPSSFSGKYHPPDEHASGGNVLHTKRVVRAVRLLARSQERDDFEVDLLTAAAILHDITKGTVLHDGQVGYDPLHPITADKFIDRVRQTDEALNSETSDSTTLMLEDEAVFRIMRMIRCSHGPWGAIPEIIPLSPMEWTLHYADNIAANLHLIVDEEVDLERWKKADT